MHQENIFRNFGTFKTKDDFLVRLDGLSLGPTHDEYTLLLGHPSQVENYDENKLKEIQEKCPPYYPVHFSPYEKKDQILPPVYILCTLSCKEAIPLDADFCFSGLSLIILEHDLSFPSLHETIEKHISNLLWKEIAKGFDV